MIFECAQVSKYYSFHIYEAISISNIKYKEKLYFLCLCPQRNYLPPFDQLQLTIQLPTNQHLTTNPISRHMPNNTQPIPNQQ